MSQEITVSAGRFPWVKAFEERFGVDKSQWRALTDAVFPNAKTLDSIVLALSYCRARNLDVFKRPVHIVPMWSTAANNGKGGMIDTIWPGIGELRTTAVRTGQFAGRDAAVWGPDATKQYGSVTVTHPEWCEVIIYRLVSGIRVACHGPRVYWAETYAWSKRDDPTPNSMWFKRPRGQIEKCAEAGALRAAFPEEIGNEYTAEEMEGKVIEGRFEQVQENLTPSATRQPAQNKLAQFAAGEPAETGKSAPTASSSAPAAFDQSVAAARVKAICEALKNCRTQKAINGVRKTEISFLAELDEHWPEGKQQIIAAIEAAEETLGGQGAAGAGASTDALADASAPNGSAP